MIDKKIITELAKKHSNKPTEGLIYAEAEKGDIQICVSGDTVALLMMIERIINRLSEIQGVSFNQMEEAIWKIRQDRKTIEKIKRGKK